MPTGRVGTPEHLTIVAAAAAGFWPNGCRHVAGRLPVATWRRWPSWRLGDGSPATGAALAPHLTGSSDGAASQGSVPCHGAEFKRVPKCPPLRLMPMGSTERSV